MQETEESIAEYAKSKGVEARIYPGMIVVIIPIGDQTLLEEAICEAVYLCDEFPYRSAIDRALNRAGLAQ